MFLACGCVSCVAARVCLRACVCVHLSVAVADACIGCYGFDWLMAVRRMPGVLQLRERGGTWQAVIDVDDGWLLVVGGVVMLIVFLPDARPRWFRWCDVGEAGCANNNTGEGE